MKINILAGGPDEFLPDLSEYAESRDLWVGVDRGAVVLLKKGIQPAIAFGDFDSVTDAEWEEIKTNVTSIKKYKSEKDESDLELALNWAIEQSPDQIMLFGCTGGRLDHFFSNIQLLIKPTVLNSNVAVMVIDKQNIIYVKGPGEHTVNKMEEKKYVSFLPFTTEVKNLSLSGFKFELDDRHISAGSTLCISNEVISDYGTFSFSEGILIVVRSSD